MARGVLMVQNSKLRVWRFDVGWLSIRGIVNDIVGRWVFVNSGDRQRYCGMFVRDESGSVILGPISEQLGISDFWIADSWD